MNVEVSTNFYFCKRKKEEGDEIQIQLLRKKNRSRIWAIWLFSRQAAAGLPAIGQHSCFFIFLKSFSRFQFIFFVFTVVRRFISQPLLSLHLFRLNFEFLSSFFFVSVIKSFSPSYFYSQLLRPLCLLFRSLPFVLSILFLSDLRILQRNLNFEFRSESCN